MTLTPSQAEAIVRIVREGLSNRFKCEGLSVVFSVDGLPDAAGLVRVKKIVGGKGIWILKICLLLDIYLLRT